MNLRFAEISNFSKVIQLEKMKSEIQTQFYLTPEKITYTHTHICTICSSVMLVLPESLFLTQEVNKGTILVSESISVSYSLSIPKFIE